MVRDLSKKEISVKENDGYKLIYRRYSTNSSL